MWRRRPFFGGAANIEFRGRIRRIIWDDDANGEEDGGDGGGPRRYGGGDRDISCGYGEFR